MSNDGERPSPSLERLVDTSNHEFSSPLKRINDRDDLHFFFASTAYRDLMKWILQLNRAMFPSEDKRYQIKVHSLDTDVAFSTHIKKLRALLRDLSKLLDQAPPDTGPRRFGNVAFRRWYQLAEDSAADLLSTHLDGVVPSLSQPLLIDELKAYLLGSFGSSQRLDYGTGHELSFLAFLGGLWKLGIFESGEEQDIVVGLIQPYLEIVRKIIQTYTLEPAGSHGVWGLDDHSFVPYIFGSAQLGPAIPGSDISGSVPTEGSLPEAPSPSSVTNKAIVTDYKNSNMYFSAIQFIYDVKKGPFWEHSPVLYDISGIKDGWGKINKGMLKMYAAEVLGKFPVVQHFPFGSLFAWESDPEAPQQSPSVHSQQQPTSAAQSKGVPPPPGPGTAAPRARAGVSSTLPQMQASTGMPSTRAPWVSNNSSGRPAAPTSSSNMPATAAPWASSSRQPSQPGMAPTAAPWARKDAPR